MRRYVLKMAVLETTLRLLAAVVLILANAFFVRALRRRHEPGPEDA